MAARDRYNKVLTLGNTVDIAELHSLVAGLPDKAPDVKPTTVTSSPTSKRFFAYSRTNRKSANGAPALHDIAVQKDRVGAITSQCSCPGFTFNGNCWASNEAMLQVKEPTRKAGNAGVWPRA